MHYLGLVILPEATDEAVYEAMEPFRYKEINYEEEGIDEPESKFDWAVVGGRWDGWLLGEEEMKKRETHNGFNFDASNRQIDHNRCKLSELSPEVIDKGPYFILCEGEWVERENFIDSKNLKECKFVPNPNYDNKLKSLIEQHPDWYAVVVDAHN